MLSGFCFLLFSLVEASQTMSKAESLWRCLDPAEGGQGQVSAQVVSPSAPRSIHDLDHYVVNR